MWGKRARRVTQAQCVTGRAEPSDSDVQAEDTRPLPPDVTPTPGIPLGPLSMTSGILVPDDGADLPAGPTEVIGYARAGKGRRVTRVDLSLDGGQTWRQAEVDDPGSPWAWQLWHTTVDLPAGTREITARAWDDAGATQPEFPASLWTPGGYDHNSWARIRVEVQ